METAVYLVKVGELTLKGGNRKDFEQRLVQNAQLYLSDKRIKVSLRAGRMYIDGPSECASDIEYALSHLVGIWGWARARVIESDLEAMKEAVLEEARNAVARGDTSFKVEARRSNKNFHLSSYDIARLTGEAVYDAGILPVNVRNPDIVITVEVRERCFVYGKQNNGHRGLPCGTGGKALLLLSGGIDSPVAGYRMIARGMKLDCLYFHSHPYTSPEAQQKVMDLARTLARYGLGAHMNTVPFTKVQEHIRDNAPAEYSTVLLRMCMMEVANRMCEFTGAKAIITGESLGQVASQTIENLTVTNECARFPVLRPLIGTDKEEIIATAKRIGTYDISILPYEDCCVLFSPKHPILKADRETAKRIYAGLKIDSLLEEAFSRREHSRLYWSTGSSSS